MLSNDLAQSGWKTGVDILVGANQLMSCRCVKPEENEVGAKTREEQEPGDMSTTYNTEHRQTGTLPDRENPGCR